MLKIGDTSFDVPYSKAYIGDSLIYTKESPSPYDYGDGSLNQVTLGYNGKIYCNGVLDVSALSQANTGNYPIPGDIFTLLYNTADVSIPNNRKIHILKGLNAYDVAFDATLEEKTCCIRITGVGGTNYAQIGDLTLNCNGTYMSFAEMVNAKKIKPIVLICSSGSSSYTWSNTLNLYDNSAYTNTKSYPEFILVFMLNAGNNITQVKFDSNINFGTSYDGLVYIMSPTSKVRLTLNAYEE